MRCAVIGLGIQGRKRKAFAGPDVVATVDPVQASDFRTIEDVPADSYEAALVCTPDRVKLELLDYLLSRGKHVMVEKPILAPDRSQIERLAHIAKKNDAVCYTAYNHRFEPHFIRMKSLLDNGVLGRIYRCRLFYGNGTARDVRISPWRDEGAGVLSDLGPHLLDTILFWFGRRDHRYHVISRQRFENAAPDHVVIGGDGTPELQLEMTLLSWRNSFACDIFAENGSAHIESLCKWGPSTFIHRQRILPSGRPEEQSVTLIQPDPTWAAEYKFFKALCRSGGGNLENDIWINTTLARLSAVGPDAT